MFDISVSFESNFDDFEKEVIKDIANDIKTKLSRGGVSGVKVMLSGSLENLQMNLDGPDDQLEKAKQVLDLD